VFSSAVHAEAIRTLAPETTNGPLGCSLYARPATIGPNARATLDKPWYIPETVACMSRSENLEMSEDIVGCWKLLPAALIAQPNSRIMRTGLIVPQKMNDAIPQATMIGPRMDSGHSPSFFVSLPINPPCTTAMTTPARAKNHPMR